MRIIIIIIIYFQEVLLNLYSGHLFYFILLFFFHICMGNTFPRRAGWTQQCTIRRWAMLEDVHLGTPIGAGCCTCCNPEMHEICTQVLPTALFVIRANSCQGLTVFQEPF